MRLHAHGIDVELPPGWEGRIYRRPHGDPTLHAANFALPAHDGDFGSYATERMRPGHVFVVLTEYRPGNGLAAGRGLFAARAIPLPIDRDRFQPGALLVARPGQRGFQHFYSESGRPFCLYAVLCVGTPGHRARAAMVDRHVKGLSDVLASVRIAPAPG